MGLIEKAFQKREELGKEKCFYWREYKAFAVREEGRIKSVHDATVKSRHDIHKLRLYDLFNEVSLPFMSSVLDLKAGYVVEPGFANAFLLSFTKLVSLVCTMLFIVNESEADTTSDHLQNLFTTYLHTVFLKL